MRTRFRQALVLAASGVGLFSFALLGLVACSHGGYTGESAPISLGAEPNAVNSLLYIAASQGYFAANGLDVVLKDYPSGLAAVDGLLNDEVDIAAAAEFVLVSKAFDGSQLQTIGSIDKFIHIFLMARKDRGIASVSDLRGKQIGVTLGTAAEFYLGRFLALNGIGMTQVNRLNVAPGDMADILADGGLDAVITWQPTVSAIEDRLGDNAIKWSVQSEQAAFDLAICQQDWVAAHPELVKRFLSALVQAEDFTADHPDEASSVVQRELEYDDAYMAAIWPQYDLWLTLDESLVLAMEDEARWMMGNNLTSAKKVPDYLNYIYVEGLLAAKPEAVSIIR